MHWFNEFSATRTGARVTSQILFASEADMKKILDMGFEEGIAIAANGLEELLDRL